MVGTKAKNLVSMVQVSHSTWLAGEKGLGPAVVAGSSTLVGSRSRPRYECVASVASCQFALYGTCASSSRWTDLMGGSPLEGVIRDGTRGQQRSAG
jgi:hypothetical protein